MSSSRNALGRGLGALLPSASTASPTSAAGEEGGPVDAASAGSNEVSLDRIDPNPDQPRRVFAQDQLDGLAASIRVHGVLQPVVVRPAGDRYELVVGERRWREKHPGESSSTRSMWRLSLRSPRLPWNVTSPA